MNLESFASNIEKTTEKLKEDRIANFEKAFQSYSSVDIKTPRHIHTINEGMVGKSINGVRFVRKVFVLDGEKVEGVFPNFKSVFNVRFPENLYKASDDMQMRYCTRKLSEKIQKNPEFAKNFTPRQLEQIHNGERKISGLTWHHTEIPGKMKLVDANDHALVRHTGGKVLWGGGNEMR